MSIYYDEQFKKEVAKKYLSGERIMDIVEKYGVTKSSIYEWSRKYGEECPNTTGNAESSASKEIRELHLKIKELEKENSFLKKAVAFFSSIWQASRSEIFSGTA